MDNHIGALKNAHHVIKTGQIAFGVMPESW